MERDPSCNLSEVKFDLNYNSHQIVKQLRNENCRYYFTFNYSFIDINN